MLQLCSAQMATAFVLGTRNSFILCSAFISTTAFFGVLIISFNFDIIMNKRARSGVYREVFKNSKPLLLITNAPIYQHHCGGAALLISEKRQLCNHHYHNALASIICYEITKMVNRDLDSLNGSEILCRSCKKILAEDANHPLALASLQYTGSLAMHCFAIYSHILPSYVSD